MPKIGPMVSQSPDAWKILLFLTDDDVEVLPTEADDYVNRCIPLHYN